jgi:hypothetical protein
MTTNYDSTILAFRAEIDFGHALPIDPACKRTRASLNNDVPWDWCP